MRPGYLREHEAAPTLALLTEVGEMLTVPRGRLV
jgi:hypothetical protein